MVADLERAIAFYQDVIGMKVVMHYGDQAAFLSFDDCHHHLGLNAWHSKEGTPPPSPPATIPICIMSPSCSRTADHLVKKGVFKTRRKGEAGVHAPRGTGRYGLNPAVRCGRNESLVWTGYERISSRQHPWQACATKSQRATQEDKGIRRQNGKSLISK